MRSLIVLLSLAFSAWSQAADQSSSASAPCNATGAPPIRTVTPVTRKPDCKAGELFTFVQNGVTRYACWNLPLQARVRPRVAGRKWPLIIYLHGSLTTPNSLYHEGKSLFKLRNTFPLSDDPTVKGFLILAPEGRRATPWPSSGFETGTGFHWDEWYRDPATNLDAAAVDHFLDVAVGTGLVDTRRVYVFGWSNGAYMSALYGVWRSDRIAAIGQYAGANPWSRTPCPLPLPVQPHVPLILLRNLCDALVSCATTSEWISELTAAQWPFEAYSLTFSGAEAPPSEGCTADCSRAKGIHNHIRFPAKSVFEKRLLPFFKAHPHG